MTATLSQILLAQDAGDIIQLVVIAIIVIGSAIMSLIKGKQEEKENQHPEPSQRGPKPPPQRHWPPTGSTTGTTVPPARPRSPQAPRAPQRPPIATPVPRAEQDTGAERIARMEAEIRRRTEKARQMEQQAAASAEQARTKAAVADRIRRAAEAVIVEAGAVQRTPADLPGTTLTQVPESIRQILSRPGWQGAILMAEILGPPVGLRDPNGQSATTPPSLAP